MFGHADEGLKKVEIDMHMRSRGWRPSGFIVRIYALI